MSTRASGRSGRTGLTVKLTEQSVSSFMPVVSPQPSGMTHQVAQTWNALKNLATMFERLTPINQQNPTSPRLFPRGAIALQAAADNTPAKQDVASIISSAEARNHRSLWAETSPGSVLLLPHGGSIAAVADIWDASYDTPTGVLSLELDVVHQPHTVSEFEPHGKQTLKPDTSHYHFDTAPGVRVDAEALLKSLQETAFGVEGVHMFLKGDSTCYYVADDGLVVTATSTPDVFAVSVTVIALSCTQRKVGGRKAVDGVGVTLFCTNCEFLEASEPAKKSSNATTHTRFRSRAPHGGQKPAGNIRRDGDFDNHVNWAEAYPVTNDGIATARIQLLTPGEPFVVIVNHYPSYQPTGGSNVGGIPYYIGNVGSQPSGEVATLVLQPAKAYRHLGDAITLTVTAFDASGVRVPDVEVAVSVFGDCKPRVEAASNTTNAAGAVAVTITGYEPGAVSVVAAAAGGAGGAPVLSNPAHLFFFERREYVDHRERDYYDSGRDGHTYTATASQMAKDQISKTTTKTN